MLKAKKRCSFLSKCGSEKNKNYFVGNNDLIKYLKRCGVRFKTQQDIEGIRQAGQLVVQTLDLVESKIKPGITTDFINDVVHDFTIKNGGIPAPLNYHGYPKSVCVSVNEVVCHGIPDDRILLDGDIVNVDITSIVNGYYADASKSFFIGKPSNDAQHIVDIARQCLVIGMETVKPGNTIGDIGYSIKNYAEANGCSVVRDFVGHGIGLDFHEPPQIPHYSKTGKGLPLLPNMIFTIEPMVNLGKKDLKILEDGWTAVTRDNSWSAQFEQTLCVTETGCESLTPYIF